MGCLNEYDKHGPESLENYTILDEKGGKYTMTEFLDKVEKLKIKSLTRIVEKLVY